jgi:RIO-like serine/threonine protein kinase
VSVPTRILLKRNLLGTVCRVESLGPEGSPRVVVERDTRLAPWWLRALARRIAAREAHTLATLARVPGVPKLEDWDGRCLRRTWLDGSPMQRAQPRDRAYFREALRLLRRLHASGIVHNDLQKESSWLVTTEVRPALFDFQVATRPRYRGRRFRALACDDLRQLLAHKRTYCAAALTPRQRAMLAPRSMLAEVLVRLGKPVHAWLRAHA